jgi:Domain of unknown function (DUF4382)
MPQSTPRLALKTWRGRAGFLLLVTLFLLLITLAFFSSGCGDTCFLFVSNPPQGTIGIAVSNPGSGCVAPKPHGAIQVTARVAPVCEAYSDSNQVRRVFVTLRGIDLRSKANATDELPIWQELMPPLEKWPVQIDLMQTSSNGSARVTFGESFTIPAGSYDLVRLRLAPNEADAGDPPAKQNPCAIAGWNCVVMGDGRIQPLLLESSTPDLVIPLEESTSGSIIVAPDSDNELLIDLSPLWSADVSGGGLRFLPLLVGRAKIERAQSSNEATLQ